MGDRINIFREKFKTVVNLTHMNEGCLKEHVYVGGWKVDCNVTAFTLHSRDRFEELYQRPFQ